MCLQTTQSPSTSAPPECGPCRQARKPSRGMPQPQAVSTKQKCSSSRASNLKGQPLTSCTLACPTHTLPMHVRPPCRPSGRASPLNRPWSFNSNFAWRRMQPPTAAAQVLGPACPACTASLTLALRKHGRKSIAGRRHAASTPACCASLMAPPFLLNCTACPCTPAVSVADSLGDVAASQGFSFYTNATDYEEPPDQSDIDGKVGGWVGGWVGGRTAVSAAQALPPALQPALPPGRPRW